MKLHASTANNHPLRAYENSDGRKITREDPTGLNVGKAKIVSLLR